MDMKPTWNDLAKRIENFRWNTEYVGMTNYLEDFFMYLCILCSTAKMLCADNWETPEILRYAFLGVYDYISDMDNQFEMFRLREGSEVSTNIYKACLFTTLCVFLNASKRIRGKSFKDFIYDTSPMRYNEPDSPNYHLPGLLVSDEEKFRRARNRRFSSREMLRQVENAQASDKSAYYKHPQWSGMTKDAEHEWALYFALDSNNPDSESGLSAEEKDIFKRLGNLYNDILPALSAPKDDGYTARLDAAYEKFLSKIKKLKYTSYLNLIQDILRHIESDKTYYGIELYRLEKELHPFAIMMYVKAKSTSLSMGRQIACREEATEIKTLDADTFSISIDICFPRLIKDFLSLPTCDETKRIIDNFSVFLNQVVGSACLVIDKLVEEGCLGDDWESLLIDMTNKMAEDVLYAPSKLDFTEYDGSQKFFQELLDAPIRSLISKNKSQET